MNKLKILTDSSADINIALANQLDIEVMPLGFSVDDTEYLAYIDEREMSTLEFYRILRSSKPVLKTSALQPQIMTSTFEKYLEDGMDIVYIAFSSGMSSTYHSATIIAEELLQRYPTSKIFVVDSLSSCVGVTALLFEAAKMREDGSSAEEIATWVTSNRLHVCHYFVVDDLDHLRRGGRLSAVGAVVGTALSIKPMIYINDEGKLIPREKIRGAQNVVPALAKRLKNMRPNEKTVFVTHTSSPEQAQKLAQLVTENYGINVVVLEIGPVVGCHTGPGAVGIVFMAESRQ